MPSAWTPIRAPAIAGGDGDGRPDGDRDEGRAAGKRDESRAAGDRDELEVVYRRIDELAPIEIETVFYRPTRPLYHWPLGFGLGLVLLYHLILGVAQAARPRTSHA